MAKQCMYCGRPLPVEEARFCNDCGRSQPPSSASPIKVKLPPKEFSRDDPHAVQQKSFTSEAASETARPPARGQSAQQPARLPKRPVRLAAEVSLAQEEKLEQKEALAPPRSADSMFSRPSKVVPERLHTADTASPRASQVASEESTMVLPGWQEELALLRKEGVVSNSPGKKAPPFPSDPDVTPRRPQSAPLRQDDLPSASAPEQADNVSEESTADPSQRELQEKMWEQAPTVHLPQPSMGKNMPGPAPAVEQTPFSSISFDPEEEAREIADLDTAMWQTPRRAEEPGQRIAEELTEQTLEEVKEVEEEPEEEDVEDLPTAILPVPELAFGQPQLKIERVSTPDPRGKAVEQAKAEAVGVEDQPTRPMLASSIAPRSPLPPGAQQQSPAQERVGGAAPLTQRSAPTPRISHPTSSPGAYGPAPSTPPSNPAQTPGSFVPAQPGHVFNPSAMPPLPHHPVSAPGNPPSWPSARGGEQALAGSSHYSPPASPVSQAPSTPQPAPAEVSAAIRKARKGYAPRVLAALLLVLLAGGVLAFIVLYQPFTNKLDQRDQSYQNASLGVSLHYPLGWKASFNQASNTVHFADSSQTGQVDLTSAASNGSTLDQYVSQKTTQLGITGLKAAPAVSFAGSTWQQIQGSINQNGATYTIALYITQRNDHFYTLACLTLPNVYAQTEHDDFAPLRASFQFI